MRVEDLLTSMREGEEQPREALEAFVSGIVSERWTRPQAAAWLAWAFQRGLTPRETADLTFAMTRSGSVLQWPEGSECIDKHSTGGVGDKVSLILAPVWAALGRRVPMISGRGLGHTGGTLDKLESIPGYRCDLETDEIRRILADVGCFINGQTADVAPADRITYALRNEVCAVESIPLIVASILSKKLAAGLDTLVLDVKCGSGAFMKDMDRASALADALVDVATRNGVACRALITEMGRPLGDTVGHALEVRESIDCLQGGGPADLRELVIQLAGDDRAATVLDDGSAYEAFARMVEAHHGDASALERPGALVDEQTDTWSFPAPASGVLHRLDAWCLGRAAFVLGGGRAHASGEIDCGVGLRIHAKPGAAVASGETLLTVHHRDGRGLDEAKAFLERAVGIDPAPYTPKPLIHRQVG